MSGTLARYSAVRGFGNTIRWLSSIPWPSPKTASPIFLSSATSARNAVSPWTIVSRNAIARIAITGFAQALAST